MLEDVRKLTKEDYERLLPRVTALKAWIADFEESALKQALSGVSFKGYKLVEGRSNRKVKDEQEMARRLMGFGLKEDDIYIKKLIGIPIIENKVSETQMMALSDLIEKPKGKPTLVEESDKRREYFNLDEEFRDLLN